MLRYPAFSSFLAFFFAGLLIISYPANSIAQVTKIMGKVTDSQTKEPIPFANILVVGTTIGMLTDFDGNYSLELKNTKAESISASLLGYSKTTKPFTKNVFQTINFELVSENLDLPEVVIKYTGNPADRLIDSIVKYKERNTFQSFDKFQYNAYTKIELDANNITEKIEEKKLFKPFQFVLAYVDTSTINGKSYLPVLISETNSVIYERKSPKSKKEIIQATQISGLDNPSVSQFFGNMSQQVDVYSNFTELFEKNFVSPIANSGHDYYKYFLVDSTYIGNKWCYHIMFKPKRKQELTYTGSLWVNDTSYAIVKIKMRIAEDANINFVNDLEVDQEFEWTDDKFWMKTKDVLLVDFNIVDNAKKLIGLYGHKTNIYGNFIFDTIDYERVFALPSDVTFEKNATDRSEEYWETSRPEALTTSEENIYKMVDSIKNVPIFRTYSNIVYGVINGYFPWKKLEIGPYSKLFSYNSIEGARFRIGARTANSFSKKVQLEGYLAYGTLDRTFKYGGEVIYMFNKNPRRVFTANYKYDVEQLGMSPNAYATDNILSSLFSRGPINKLTMVREYKISYEHEWFNGLINTLAITHRELFPLKGAEFVIFPENTYDTVYTNSIYTNEIGLSTRISFDEKYISGEFYRVTLKSQYPIIMINYKWGVPNIFSNDYGYQKLNIGISQWFNLGTIGWSKYVVEWGKIWGTLPYPLLKIHDGNQTFLYDDYASNLMLYYEFVSDNYVNFYFSHHFDGLFFNRVPFLRKLKWREVAHFRGVYGSLTDANLNYSEFPEGMRPLGNTPYLEAGGGIENIFKIFRIDAVWRLTHLHDAENPDAINFGIFASVYFSF